MRVTPQRQQHRIWRCENEAVAIGEIVVTVLEVRDDHVRLAISSPRSTPSYREETLYWARQEAELQHTS